MRTLRQISLAAVLLLSAPAANAQVATASSTATPGIPLTSLIATVAQKTGMKFVLDPRVRAAVTLVGEEPSSVTYDELLTILETYGFAAVPTGGYVLVVPDAYVRAEPLPLVSDGERVPDGEFVTAVFHVKSIPAGWLVPILRPLVPQFGHLAAMPCSNDLVIVERFANVRRIEGIVKALDTGAPIKVPTCSVPMPHSYPMPH
jgi:type II secretory pathway component GspD/PulD (secretin)